LGVKVVVLGKSGCDDEVGCGRVKEQALYDSDLAGLLREVDI
jgi:hypothetical protein